MAIIKEDGTRKDIGIYEDDNDADPCMPSIVAFSRNGELLIGEKALRQAVVNPDSTIYEVCNFLKTGSNEGQTRMRVDES